MPKFRQKPIVVEAVQCTERTVIRIDLLTSQVAEPGDWIVTDIFGQRDVYSPFNFELVFEPVPDEES